uniref:Uncharacterized protein n=2 Tax=Oryza sativa subsp. japonica TaxID=39947 RepID=Q9LIX0_ORYSJ|nr:hypothetical protein [Oryza sativa]
METRERVESASSWKERENKKGNAAKQARKTDGCGEGPSVTLVRGSNWGEAEREREGARDSWRAVAAGRWRSRFPSCATASFLHPLRWMVKS